MKTILPPLARTGSLGPLSEHIIPATPGTSYVYSSVFTGDRPLYALLDCKANKSRALAHAGMLGREVHLHFVFEDTTHATVSSIKAAKDAKLLGDINAEFDEVFVAPAGIAIEDFYTLSARRDSKKLIKICQTACQQHETCAFVTSGNVIAVLTGGRKYGLFLVKELTPTSASIDAYHILAP